MNIKAYKRYFWDESAGKTIASITNATAAEIHELTEYLYRYKRTSFRKIRLSFAVEGSNDANDDNYPTFSILADEFTDSTFSQKYVNILMGEYPEWQIARVEICDDSIGFLVVKFDGNGTVVPNSFDTVYLEHLPIGTSLKVEIDNADNTEADTYLIFNRAERGDEKPVYVVEEYKKSNLLRTCTICKDSKGGFELVKESN